MDITVSSKGQIVLPAELRHRDEIRAGQRFEVERIDRGEYVLRRKAGPRNAGLVDLLLSCPVKDWFEALDRSASTDAFASVEVG